MRFAAAGRTLAVLTVVCIGNAVAQPALPGNSATLPPTTNVLTVPAGESLVLELKSPLNSGSARKGDRADFSTTSETLVGDQVAISRGTIVRATITQAKRAGAMRKPQLQFEFNEIVLPNHTVQPLAANLTHGAWSRPRGEYSRRNGVHTVMSDAATGAILGVIFGGSRGAVRGASAGAAIGAIGVLSRHGPDLDFPPGMMFEIELTKPLNVPVPALSRSQIAMNQPPPLSPSDSTRIEPPKENVVVPAIPESPPELTRRPISPNPSTDNATVAANRTPPPAPTPAAAPVDPSPVPGESGGFKLKMDVELVVVETTVRDQYGGIIGNLKRENFHLYEDGVEQQISHFSRDELPLAVALVVDRSGSMGPVIEELRHAAYETLSLLKPDDQVALFAFAATSERLEYLTTDRQRIAEDIASIRASGGTNISDALFDAALYLGRAAPGRRHAVILVSDNENTVRGFASDNEVIRLALETEAVIYSIKIGGGWHGRMLNLPLPLAGTGFVPKMAQQTGGEVIDANNLGSVQSAMAAVIARLKQRYSLGYYSTNRRRDGTFRQIDIRVADPHNLGPKYTVYARRGYYARGEHSASRGH